MSDLSLSTVAEAYYLFGGVCRSTTIALHEEAGKELERLVTIQRAVENGGFGFRPLRSKKMRAWKKRFEKIERLVPHE